ncbi:sugar transferase [Blastococcus capsensis]|uniref:sugar transferase n=1 Tax=Blastococcus capsensis TaxID=1564163 RepID=UPI002541D881|nr:sugar transferase [Blastococcus capsensis]MDK3257137.1 sugar transferase [Blastococcus capsensis]
MSGYPAVKRGVDIAVSAAVLVVTGPLQAVLAMAVRRDLGSPVLFRQQRPGRHGELFELVKFRTMRDDPTARDAQRLTRFGCFLRSTSLDELPTMWNVLRGDMSLVGPRPLLPAYLSRYTPEQARRHDVRPGVTGLAQVRGRNAVSWEDRFRADVEYVERLSARLDVSILLKTVALVLRRTGIAADGAATMSEFLGTGTPGPASVGAVSAGRQGGPR